MSVRFYGEESESQPFLAEENGREPAVENSTMLSAIGNLGRSIVASAASLVQYLDCSRERTAPQPSRAEQIEIPASRILRVDQVAKFNQSELDEMRSKIKSVTDRKLVMAFIQADPKIRLSDLNSCFGDDEEIVRLCVERNGRDLQYANNRLRGDFEMNSLALANTIDVLPFCLNREAVLATLLANPGLGLINISDSLRGDEEIVALCVERNGMDLEHADDHLRRDFVINNLAVANTPEALGFCLNRNLILSMIQQDAVHFIRLSLPLFYEDPELLQAASEAPGNEMVRHTIEIISSHIRRRD
ncbi:MAG: DUF4116 domain-containing protein, partial [Chlamydiales bacterium]|nr:DUF4116 domain-containing protein [Chlamydiales bacterium]